MLLLNKTDKYAPELFLFPSASQRFTESAVIFGGAYARTVAVALAVAVLPLESVTVTLIVTFPALETAPVVNDAAVYVFPSAVVLYALIVEPYNPEAEIVTFNFDKP